MYFHLFVSLFMLLSSCSPNHQPESMEKFAGVWKVTEGQEGMIQISADSILEMYDYTYPGGLRFKIKNITPNTLTLSYLNPQQPQQQKNATGYQTKSESNNSSVKVFNYVLNGDHLELTNEAATQVIKATHCRAGGCDLQPEFFRKTGVTIDLPVQVNDGDQQANSGLEETDVPVYIGRPKANLEFGYGKDYRFWTANSFSDEGKLEMDIFRQLKSKAGQNSRIICFVDADAPVALIGQLKPVLEKLNIDEVYFGIRTLEDRSAKLYLSYRKVKLSEVKIENPGESFASWIK